MKFLLKKGKYYILILFIIGLLVVIFSLFRECHQLFRDEVGLQVTRHSHLLPPKSIDSNQSNLLNHPVQTQSPSRLTASVSVSNSKTDNSEKLQSRIEELMLLGMKDDKESLKIICTELTNSEKEIRLSAANALVQFRDDSVVPRLRSLAIQAKDPQEQAHFNEAAEQLSLPSFTALRKLQQGKKQN